MALHRAPRPPAESPQSPQPCVPLTIGAQPPTCHAATQGASWLCTGHPLWRPASPRLVAHPSDVTRQPVAPPGVGSCLPCTWGGGQHAAHRIEGPHSPLGRSCLCWALGEPGQRGGGWDLRGSSTTFQGPLSVKGLVSLRERR